MDEEAIVKRIIKDYLYFKGEASTRMIINHIEKVGFGLRKGLTVAGLSKKMRIWSQQGKSNSWFQVTYTKKHKERWWRLV